MKLFRLLFLFAALWGAGLRVLAHDHSAEKNPAGSAPAETGYALRGVVTQVLADQKLVLIKHEEIPGFMRAMTMAFHVPADVYPHLVPGTPVAATMLPKRPDGWHLEAVRVLAPAGSTLTPGVPYRVALTGTPGAPFRGNFTFTAPAAGDWRFCVSHRAAWTDVILGDNEPLASKACTHANPPGFAKGPLYALEAAKSYELRLTKAPAAELDVLILPFTP